MISDQDQIKVVSNLFDHFLDFFIRYIFGPVEKVIIEPHLERHRVPRHELWAVFFRTKTKVSIEIFK